MVVPDRPSAQFAEEFQEPDTLIRLTVEQSRAQARWEASQISEDFQAQRTCLLVRNLEDITRWLRAKGSQEVGCYAPSSLHELDMAHLAEELIQDLREQHKLLLRATRGRHCIFLRELVGEEHPLPDPAYRPLQRDRKRAHNSWQDGCRRERNRGAEKRQRANNKRENQESRPSWPTRRARARSSRPPAPAA